jgi:hypothetical protein
MNMDKTPPLGKGLRGGEGIAVCFFRGQQLAFKIVTLQIVVRISSTFRRGPDGELETLDGTVAELAGPHNVFGTHHRHDGASQRHKVGISTYFNGLGGANLYAGKTFPALIGFLVVSLHGVGFKDHEVVGANVHASGFIATLATVTFFLNDKTWHLIYLHRWVKNSTNQTSQFAKNAFSQTPPFIMNVRVTSDRTYIKAKLLFLSFCYPLNDEAIEKLPINSVGYNLNKIKSIPSHYRLVNDFR